MYEPKYHIKWPFRPHMPHITETFCSRSINEEMKLCSYDPHTKELYFYWGAMKRYVLKDYQVCKTCAKQAKIRIMPYEMSILRNSSK
jgi:hypothetical protein